MTILFSGVKLFGPAVQQEMASKDFFIFLALVPFCSTVELFESWGRAFLVNFGAGPYKEHFSEAIFDRRSAARRRCLIRIFLFLF